MGLSQAFWDSLLPLRYIHSMTLYPVASGVHPCLHVGPAIAIFIDKASTLTLRSPLISMILVLCLLYNKSIGHSNSIHSDRPLMGRLF